MKVLRKVVGILTAVILVAGFESNVMAATVGKDWNSTNHCYDTYKGGSNDWDCVMAIQRFMLEYNSTTKSYLINYGMTGYFGDATYNAVYAFQSSKGLQTDGLVGAYTWAAMKDTLKLADADYGFSFYKVGNNPQTADGIPGIWGSFRCGNSTGNWGARPWGCSTYNSTVSWHVFAW